MRTFEGVFEIMTKISIRPTYTWAHVSFWFFLPKYKNSYITTWAISDWMAMRGLDDDGFLLQLHGFLTDYDNIRVSLYSVMLII